MLATLPAASHAAAAAYADGRLPPVALIVAAVASSSDAEPVTVTLRTHPRWAARLRAAGATRRRGGWVVRRAYVDDVLAVLGPQWVTDPATAPTTGQPTGRARRQVVTVTARRDRRPGLNLLTHPDLAPAELAAVLGAGHGTVHRVSAADARTLVDQARRVAIPVLRASDRAVLADLDEAADRTVVARALPGMPAMLTLTAGQALTDSVPDTVPADRLRDIRLPAGTRLLLRIDAADAAAVAAAVPQHLPGLHPWQDLFVARYLSTTRGLVNALAPGLGKSGAALAALRARSAGADHWRSLIVAPSTSRSQWPAEAARFFPDATLWDAGTGTLLRQALTTLTTDRPPGPHLVLTTPDLLARADHTDTGWDDLVVDEGTFLTQATSAKAAAVWAARARATRAMVLTGTPQKRRLGDLQPLVEFALGQPEVFEPLPLDAYHPVPPTDRVGAYVHTHDAPTPAPVAEHVVPVLPATPADLAVDACVRSRLEDLLAGDEVTVARRVDQELKAARLGYADPAALLASRYPLAADVRVHLGDAAAAAVAAAAVAAGPAAGAKLPAVAGLVRDAVGRGEQVLVFSDFLGPLAALETELAAGAGPVSAGVISSKTAPARREQTFAAFRNGTLPVLLLSGTAHLGLNLQQATTVLHLDVPTTHAALVQRAARAARLGSTADQVTSIAPVVDTTVEDRLADLLGARGLRPATRDNHADWLRRVLAPPLRAAAAAGGS